MNILLAASVRGSIGRSTCVLSRGLFLLRRILFSFLNLTLTRIVVFEK